METKPGTRIPEKGDLHKVGRPPHRRRLYQIPPEYSRPTEAQHLHA
jgi:hypothetical protein